MIDVINLKKSFDDTEVLKGINVTIHKGDIVVVPTWGEFSIYKVADNNVYTNTSLSAIISAEDLRDWDGKRAHVAKDKEGYYVFHAGSKMTDKGIVTNGGRVLGVTAKGSDLVEARANAYKATEWISFDNKYMRHDIGKAIDEQ